MKKKIFIISGFIPLIFLFKRPADPLPLIYSFFIFINYFGYVIKEAIRNIPFNAYTKFVLLIIIIGLITEILAWLSNFLAKNDPVFLFHPQLVYDLLISFSMYSAWAIAWLFLSRRYKYSIRDVFIIQGLYGVFIEQQGKVFLQGISKMPFALVFWVYTFIIYGSIAGSAYMLSGENDNLKNKNIVLRYIIALFSIMVASIIFFIIWGFFLNLLNIIPSPKPISTYPIW